MAVIAGHWVKIGSSPANFWLDYIAAFNDHYGANSTMAADYAAVLNTLQPDYVDTTQLMTGFTGAPAMDMASALANNTAGTLIKQWAKYEKWLEYGHLNNTACYPIRLTAKASLSLLGLGCQDFDMEYVNQVHCLTAIPGITDITGTDCHGHARSKFSNNDTLYNTPNHIYGSTIFQRGTLDIDVLSNADAIPYGLTANYPDPMPTIPTFPTTVPTPTTPTCACPAGPPGANGTMGPPGADGVPGPPLELGGVTVTIDPAHATDVTINQVGQLLYFHFWFKEDPMEFKQTTGQLVNHDEDGNLRIIETHFDYLKNSTGDNEYTTKIMMTYLGLLFAESDEKKHYRERSAPQEI